MIYGSISCRLFGNFFFLYIKTCDKFIHAKQVEKNLNSLKKVLDKSPPENIEPNPPTLL